MSDKPEDIPQLVEMESEAEVGQPDGEQGRLR